MSRGLKSMASYRLINDRRDLELLSSTFLARIVDHRLRERLIAFRGSLCRIFSTKIPHLTRTFGHDYSDNFTVFRIVSVSFPIRTVTSNTAGVSKERERNGLLLFYREKKKVSRVSEFPDKNVRDKSDSFPEFIHR